MQNHQETQRFHDRVTVHIAPDRRQAGACPPHLLSAGRGWTTGSPRTPRLWHPLPWLHAHSEHSSAPAFTSYPLYLSQNHLRSDCLQRFWPDIFRFTTCHQVLCLGSGSQGLREGSKHVCYGNDALHPQRLCFLGRPPGLTVDG